MIPWDEAGRYGAPGLVLAALGAAAGRYLESWLKAREARRNAPPPEMIRRAEADASFLSVTASRTGLERDLAAERAAHAADRALDAQVLEAERAENTRLRRALAEEEARNVERENAMNARIEELEDRVRKLLADLDALKRGNTQP